MTKTHHSSFGNRTDRHRNIEISLRPDYEVQVVESPTIKNLWEIFVFGVEIGDFDETVFRVGTEQNRLRAEGVVRFLQESAFAAIGAVRGSTRVMSLIQCHLCGTVGARYDRNDDMVVVGDTGTCAECLRNHYPKSAELLLGVDQ